MAMNVMGKSGSWAILALMLPILCASAQAAFGATPLLEPTRTVGLGSLSTLCVSPREDVLMTGSGEGLQLWTMEGKLVSKPITGTRANALWSHDGSRILVGLENGSCVILDSKGKVLASLRSSGWPVWVGDEAVVVGQIGAKHVFLDLVNGSLLGELDAPGNILGSAFSHWSKLVAITYGGEGYVYVSSLSNWSSYISSTPLPDIWVSGEMYFTGPEVENCDLALLNVISSR
jgi:hypothetical protein